MRVATEQIHECLSPAFRAVSRIYYLICTAGEPTAVGDRYIALSLQKSRQKVFHAGVFFPFP